MNRTASIRIKGLNPVALKENLPFIVLLTITLISILFGALSTSYENFKIFSEELLNRYLQNRSSEPFISKMLLISYDSLKCLIFSFLCGTSALGLILSPLSLGYLSFCYGSMAGMIYIKYGIYGIVFNLFVLIIPSLIVMLSMIISAKECVFLSLKITQLYIKDKRPISLYNSFKMYCLKHLLLLIPIFISVILDSVLFDIFEKYIN